MYTKKMMQDRINAKFANIKEFSDRALSDDRIMADMIEYISQQLDDIKKMSAKLELIND